MFYLLFYDIGPHCAAVKYTFSQCLVGFAVLMLEVCIMIIFRHYHIKKVMAGGPNLQGMDSLTAAMQNNIVPDQEYLLQVPFIKEDLFASWKIQFVFQFSTSSISC